MMRYTLGKLRRLCSISVLGILLGLLWFVALRVMLRASLDERASQDGGVPGIQRAMNRIACEQTALFVLEHMPRTPTFADKFALLDHSLASVDPKLDGKYCEFGVYTGTTINHIASRIKHSIDGFDSFEGLPEDWRTGYGKGTFALSGLPKVRENVSLHKGWFNESLPIWSVANPGPIAFMHMDADLYSATKTVFDLLGERIVPGTIIQFDEFFNYPAGKIENSKPSRSSLSLIISNMNT
jgi:Methyltransferase domain